jgi:hypothetical protein
MFTVLFALCSVVLFLVAALVVDLGLARDVKGKSQNAADAAALAAGNVIYADGTGRPNWLGAVAAAEEYGTANLGTTADDWSGCTDADRPAGYYVVPGTTPCISFDDPIAPTHVRVRMPDRVVQTGFGSLTGVQEIGIGTGAEASLHIGYRSPCGICVVGTALHDIQNGEIEVLNANLRANGSMNLQSNGHITVNGGSIGVQGTATGANYSPSAITGIRPIPDPLAAYVPPPLPPSPASYKTNPCTDGPGIYSTVSVTAQSVCTLQPGIYYVTGTWSITSQGSMDATSGVTLFFTCSTSVNGVNQPRACASTGESGGQLNASGQGGLAIKPPTSGPTQGISVMYDRHNTSGLVYTGQGSLRQTTGTFYAPAAELLFNGNGNGVVMDTLIVVRDLELNGNPAKLRTKYSPALNAPIKPLDLALSK